MKILDKYILKEMIVPFLAGFLAVLILLVGNIVYNNISIIVSKIGQWNDVLYFIFLQTPSFVMIALPAGALFGSSLAISRLARDSEITMIRIAGVSMRRIMLPALIFGVLLSIIGYVFQEVVTVWAEKESNVVMKRLWIAPSDPPLQANTFFKIGDQYFFVNSINRKNGKIILGNIMIYEPPTAKGFPQLTTASEAEKTNNVWKLNKGTSYRINEAGEPEMVANFKSMDLDTERPLAEYFNDLEKSPKTMTINQLQSQVGKLRQTGQSADTFRLELGYKLAMPLSSIVLILCIVPLSLKFGKNGGFMGVLIGICVLFFYWNIILFSRVLGETGGLPAWIAGWSEVVIFGVLGIFLSYKVEHY